MLKTHNVHDKDNSCTTDWRFLARFSRKGQMWEMIRGVLTVVVMRAEDLLPTDFNGKSDPYVVLNMRKHKRSKKKTMVC